MGLLEEMVEEVRLDVMGAYGIGDGIDVMESNKPEYVIVRQVSTYIVFMCLGLGYTHTGRVIWGIDHSTVRSSIGKVELEMERGGAYGHIAMILIDKYRDKYKGVTE